MCKSNYIRNKVLEVQREESLSIIRVYETLGGQCLVPSKGSQCLVPSMEKRVIFDTVIFT